MDPTDPTDSWSTVDGSIVVGDVVGVVVVVEAVVVVVSASVVVVTAAAVVVAARAGAVVWCAVGADVQEAASALGVSLIVKADAATANEAMLRRRRDRPDGKLSARAGCRFPASATPVAPRLGYSIPWPAAGSCA